MTDFDPFPRGALHPVLCPLYPALYPVYEKLRAIGAKWGKSGNLQTLISANKNGPLMRLGEMGRKWGKPTKKIKSQLLCQLSYRGNLEPRIVPLFGSVVNILWSGF